MFIFFLTILFIALVVGRIAAGFYSAAIPFLAELCLPLTLICIGVGAFWLSLVIVKIYNEVKGKK